MILRWKTIQATATREEKVIDAISISLWESVALSNSDPPILISQIPHSKDLGSFRVIQWKYGNVRKSHLIEEFLKQLSARIQKTWTTGWHLWPLISRWKVLVTHLEHVAEVWRPGATLLTKSHCLSLEDSHKFSCVEIHIRPTDVRELINLLATGGIERLYADMVSTQREQGGLFVYRETRAPLCTWLLEDVNKKNVRVVVKPALRSWFC